MTWALPRDLHSFGLRVSLSSEPLLLYWHTTDAEVDVLLEILRAGADDVGSTLVIDESALALLKDRSLPLARTVVAVLVQNSAVGLDAVMEGAKALSARAALIRFPEPQQTGYGWLERDVKSSLYKAMGAWFASVEHPLAPLGVRAFPMMEAAGLTADPVELLALVEAALRHRLRYVDLGTSGVDYRRSLLLAAGERLAERFKVIPAELQHPALEVLLRWGQEPVEQGRFEQGAKALGLVGLGRFMEGKLRIGPLGQALSEIEVLGAFEVSLPNGAWSEAAKAASTLRRLRDIDEWPIELIGPTTIGFDSLPIPTANLDGPLEEVFIGESRWKGFISLVESLSTLPLYLREPPPKLQTKLSDLLRWIASLHSSSEHKIRSAASMMEALLGILSRRGVGQESEREMYLVTFREGLRESGSMDDASTRDLIIHISLWCADMAVARAMNAKAVALMKRTIEDGMSVWTDPIHLSAMYQRLSTIALWEGEYDAAYEWIAKALESAKQSGDARSMIGAALGRANIAVAKRYFSEAIATLQGITPLLERTEFRYILGRAKIIESLAHGLQGRAADALDAGHKALELARSVHDEKGARNAWMAIATALAFEDASRAEGILQVVAAQAEQAHDLLDVANAHASLLLSFLRRGAIDECMHSIRELIRYFRVLGVPERHVAKFEQLHNLFMTLPDERSPHDFRAFFIEYLSRGLPVSSRGL